MRSSGEICFSEATAVILFPSWPPVREGFKEPTYQGILPPFKFLSVRLVTSLNILLQIFRELPTLRRGGSVAFKDD